MEDNALLRLPHDVLMPLLSTMCTHAGSSLERTFGGLQDGEQDGKGVLKLKKVKKRKPKKGGDGDDHAKTQDPKKDDKGGDDGPTEQPGCQA